MSVFKADVKCTAVFHLIIFPNLCLDQEIILESILTRGGERHREQEHVYSVYQKVRIGLSKLQRFINPHKQIYVKYIGRLKVVTADCSEALVTLAVMCLLPNFMQISFTFLLSCLKTNWQPTFVPR